MHFPAAHIHVTCASASSPLPALKAQTCGVPLGCGRAADLGSLTLKDGVNLHAQRATNSVPEQGTAKVRWANGASPACTALSVQLRCRAGPAASEGR